MAESTLSIIPLGGATEIGKNITVYRCGDQLLVVDCGLMFPDEELLGVDVLLPDVTYLLENKEKVLGIVLTHGHEDHIGALPYVLRELPVPIWASRLTLGLIRPKLHEHGLWADTDWHLAEDGERVQIGPFNVEFVHVCHSIPDSCSLVIRTPAGNVVHTSDFKFDQTPVDGRLTDLQAFSRAGEEGLAALVVDSTNADKPGHVQSERVVADALDSVFRDAEGRIIVTSFASNISRIQQVFDASRDYDRRVAIAGRSMQQNVNIARELGFLTVEENELIRLEQVADLRPEQVTIITTGSQGEPLSALTRMAMGDHRHIQIVAGDTVIYSSTPVPGNEDLVMRTINHLFKHGAYVVYTQTTPNIHVSGHANREELKLMLNLTRPKHVIPVHGEYRHHELWRRMAAEMGYTTIDLEHGDVLEVDMEKAEVTGKVQAGSVIVDGTGQSGIEDMVLRDRHHLSQDGIFCVVVSVDRASAEVIAGPDVVSRGAVLEAEADTVIEEAKQRVVEQLAELPNDGTVDWATVRTDLRRSLNKLLQQKTGRRPMVVPVIMEI